MEGVMLGLASATGFALGASWARMRRSHRSPSGDGWGSACWGTPIDLKASGLRRAHGVIVGYDGRHPLRAPRGTHILVVGPSGSGKSVLLTKTLRTYPHSVIVLDLKGSLHHASASCRARFGPVYIFDPVHGGDHLNPWSLIRWGTGSEVADIQRVVSHLTYTEADTRSDAGLYYLAEAQETLWALLPYVHYSLVTEASFGGLRKYLAVSGQEIRTRLRAMQAFGHPTPHPVVQDWASQMLGKSADLLDRIWSAARRWLMPWVDPVLSWNTQETTIDWQAFQQAARPASLFLRVSVEDLQGRLRSFVRLVLDLLSLRLCDRPEHAFRHDVLWVLDDLSELRRLEMLERLHAYLRGYGHFLLAGTQSFAQLWQWFGTQNGLLNNSTLWALFRPMDPDEAEYISRALGETTVAEPVRRQSRGRWGGSVSTGLQTHRRRLCTADEVLRLGHEQLIVRVAGAPPFLVHRGPEGLA